MVRTQIQLTEAQARALKRLAAARSVSMAEVIRQAIDQHVNSEKTLGREELRRRAANAAGRFLDPRGDLAEEHDVLAAQAFEGGQQ